MTTEQKVKAYDMALERFKAFKEKYYTKDTVIGDAVFDKTGEMQKDFEAIFPQLRESEDGRIHRELTEYLNKYVSDSDTRKKYWLLYLDKNQKQGKIQRCGISGYTDIITAIRTVYNEESAYELIEYFTNLVNQDEQKPNSTEDIPYIADEHFYEREPVDSFKYRLAEYMTKNCKKGEGPDEYSYGISSESILQMAKEELIKRGELQKPAEWSEEDVKMIEFINLKLGQVDCLSDTVLSARAWLKSMKDRLLKSLHPQPKQEWSEKDKKILDDVSHILIGLNYKQIAKDYKQAVEKLIYARPTWKPSELEKGALRTAIHVLTDERSFPKAAAQLQNILDAFEGKESRKDWKPSKEQMAALKWQVEHPELVKWRKGDLESLYEQLKKL